MENNRPPVPKVESNLRHGILKMPEACYEASAQSIQNGANGYTMLSLDLNR